MAILFIVLLFSIKKLNPISPLPKVTIPYKNCLSLFCKKINEEDCKILLGRTTYLENGYQPLLINITNNTIDKSFAYSKSSLDLPTVDAAIVANEIKIPLYRKDAVYLFKRTFAWFLIGGIIILFSYTSALVSNSKILPTWFYVLMHSYWIGFILFICVEGWINPKDPFVLNEKISLDFTKKAFPNEVIIRPSQSISGIVFIPKESFTDFFTITLNDNDTNQTITLQTTTENNTSSLSVYF